MNPTAANGRKDVVRTRRGRFAIARLPEVVLLAAVAATAVACGGDSADSGGLSCGPGTTANGGSCTPACGAGTTFDATTKTCVAVGGSGGAAGAGGAGGSAQAGAAGISGASGFPAGHPCGPVAGAKRIINCNIKCGVLDVECGMFQCSANVEQVELKASDVPLAVRVGGPLPTPACKNWGCTLGMPATRLMLLPFSLPDVAGLRGHSSSPDWFAQTLRVHPKDGAFEACPPWAGDGMLCWDRDLLAPVDSVAGFVVEPMSQTPGEAIVTLSFEACP